MKIALSFSKAIMAGFLFISIGSLHPTSAGILSQSGQADSYVALPQQTQRGFKRPTSLADRVAEPAPIMRFAARNCPSGLVWRERFDGDTVCVLPGIRDENRRKRGLQTGPAARCPSGLVWRERYDGDTVCVLPGVRDENRRARGLQTGPASLCPAGLVWRERFEGDTVCVPPRIRDANRRARGL